MHRGVEERHCSRLGRLGSVHRSVGVVQDLLGGGVLDDAGRDSDARAGHDLVAVELVHFRESRLHSLGHDQRTGSIGVSEQNHELVAAESRPRVHGAQLLCDVRPHRDEHAVAHLVPERVVDELEAVDVEEEHGERRFANAATGRAHVPAA